MPARKGKIGPGLVLFHFCGTFIHDGFVAGRNLTVGQGVLIGCDNQGLAAHVGIGGVPARLINTATPRAA